MNGQFNFRHVMMRVGVPLNNHNSWEVGKILSDLAAKNGVEKSRILTEKTDPNPSVPAPHCICHYSMEMFDEACAKVSDAFDNRSRQLTMF